MSEELHPEQIRALRKMTLTQRLKVGLGFIEQMRELRAAMLRREHPDWTPAQISQALRDFISNAAPNPLSIFAPGLNRTGLQWMAVGSIASNAYGEFRVTKLTPTSASPREPIRHVPLRPRSASRACEKGC